MKKPFLHICIFILFTLFAFAPATKENLNVVFIGDSITRGTASKDQSPPSHTENMLRQLNQWKKVQVSNQGRSGNTTLNFLPTSKSAYASVRAAADQFYQDKTATLVFCIMLGTNDSAIKGPLGSPVSPSTYHSNLRTITDSLLSAYPECRIVFNYPLWYSDNAQNKGAEYKKEGQLRIRAYWPEVDELVKSYKKSHKGQVFTGDKKAYNYFKENHLTDFRTETGPSGTFYLHPNEQGDKTLAGFWVKAIVKALK
ncbi:lysophospholipase L1-like esterase [Arcticibacter pallidicorallinus]|uniref:Lysophospholipase L1-like esterase n=1 Tax=Arcticibacter pallidicorallinus TaxID=1259464 RepID=A0A2T0U474_9SPHI|nr:GDSL-type esterase/lipase family protein [Arcticibacter pallidicorallinus]PRY52658.1 lysophospholipase L1-like esterase [Arcticibacter pallidicorallinus]